MSAATAPELETIQISANGRRFSALSVGSGPLVLCVHGFPDHHHSFRHQLPAFADAGYRAVAPLLRGYEPTSQGAGQVKEFHLMRVASDLIAWAKRLSPEEPAHLVGHDWGGVATYIACALEPDVFRSASTLAVPPMHAIQPGIRRHPVQLRNSWYMFFFQLRGVADRFVADRDFAFIERLWRDWSPGWSWEPQEMEHLKERFRQPGVARCALAYYRAIMSPFLADSRTMRRLVDAPVEVPTLAITGATDGCLDTRIYDCVDASRFPKGYRMERVPTAGHFVHQEKPEVANPVLLEWFAEHGA